MDDDVGAVQLERADEAQVGDRLVELGVDDGVEGGEGGRREVVP